MAEIWNTVYVQCCQHEIAITININVTHSAAHQRSTTSIRFDQLSVSQYDAICINCFLDIEMFCSRQILGDVLGDA
jgi:hypothetical protein